MGNTITFPIHKIKKLRINAEKIRKVDDRGSEGWSKSTVNPMELLSIFNTLWLKKGLVLRAYQFREGGNGNGIVWAMPEDLTFPDPESCDKLIDRFLEPPKPPGAIDNIMESVEGDGSPWSYLSASLFAREAAEFGALWHGSSWSTHEILGEAPSQFPYGKASRRGIEDPDHNHDEWKWLEAKPEEWMPMVCEEGNVITVVFYTFSGLGGHGIYRHLDTYEKGQYQFKTEKKLIAEGTGGYVF